jgi:hypothetical protein
MSKRRIIKSVLHNFLETYMSRNSDLDGYWLFGYLVEDIQKVRFNLLDVNPDIDNSPTAVAKRLAVKKFSEQIEKAKLSQAIIQGAFLDITKTSVTDGEYVTYNGHFFIPHKLMFVVNAQADNGKMYEWTASLIVDQHNPTLELRSSRLSCPVCRDSLPTGTIICSNCGTEVHASVGGN